MRESWTIFWQIFSNFILSLYDIGFWLTSEKKYAELAQRKCKMAENGNEKSPKFDIFCHGMVIYPFY